MKHEIPFLIQIWHLLIGPTGSRRL